MHKFQNFNDAVTNNTKRPHIHVSINLLQVTDAGEGFVKIYLFVSRPLLPVCPLLFIVCKNSKDPIAFTTQKGFNKNILLFYYTCEHRRNIFNLGKHQHI